MCLSSNRCNECQGVFISCKGVGTVVIVQAVRGSGSLGPQAVVRAHHLDLDPKNQCMSKVVKQFHKKNLTVKLRKNRMQADCVFQLTPREAEGLCKSANVSTREELVDVCFQIKLLEGLDKTKIVRCCSECTLDYVESVVRKNDGAAQMNNDDLVADAIAGAIGAYARGISTSDARKFKTTKDAYFKVVDAETETAIKVVRNKQMRQWYSATAAVVQAGKSGADGGKLDVIKNVTNMMYFLASVLANAGLVQEDHDKGKVRPPPPLPPFSLFGFCFVLLGLVSTVLSCLIAQNR